MLSGQTEEALLIFHQSGAAAVHKNHKEKEIFLWSKEYQDEMTAKRKADPRILALQGKSASKRWIGQIVEEEDQLILSYKGEETLCTRWCSLGKEIDVELQKIYSPKTEVSRGLIK